MFDILKYNIATKIATGSNDNTGRVYNILTG